MNYIKLINVNSDKKAEKNKNDINFCQGSCLKL